jgi:hypothetical protein
VLGGRGHAQHAGPAPRPVLRQEQDHAA